MTSRNTTNLLVSTLAGLALVCLGSINTFAQKNIKTQPLAEGKRVDVEITMRTISSDMIKSIDQTKHRSQQSRKEKQKAADEVLNKSMMLVKKGEKASAYSALEQLTLAQKLFQEIQDFPGIAQTDFITAMAYTSLGDYQNAIIHGEKSIKMWKIIGDQAGEATAITGLGLINYKFGEFQKALENYLQAIPLLQSAGDRDWEASTCSTICKIYSNLGEFHKGIEFGQKALMLYKDLQDEVEQAKILILMGELYWKSEQAKNAIDPLISALSIYRKLGDASMEATVLYRIGLSYTLIEDQDTAINYFNQGLSIFSQNGDQLMQVLTYNRLGRAYLDLADLPKALENYLKAQSINTSLNDKSEHAYSLRGLGGVFHEQGDLRKALEYYEKGLLLTQEAKDQKGEAFTLNNIGLVYFDLGRVPQSLKTLSHALQVFQKIHNVKGIRMVLHNLGLVYSGLGEMQKALHYYESALQLNQAVNDFGGIAHTLSNIGTIYHDLGLTQKALTTFNEALKLRKIIGDRSGEASTLSNIGGVYYDLRDFQKALEYYHQALGLYENIGNKTEQATVLNNIGTLYSATGEKQKSLEKYEQALRLSRFSGNLEGEATTLHNVGSIYFDLGKDEVAIDNIERSLFLFKRLGNLQGIANTLSGLMIVYESMSKLNLAIYYGKKSVQAHQEIRFGIKDLDEESRRSYLKKIEYTYRFLTYILISKGKLLEAEQVLALLKEEEHTRLLRRRKNEALLNIGLNPTETVAAKLLDQVAELGKERYDLLELKEKQQLSQSQIERLNQLERDLLPKANAEFRNALTAIQKEAPDLTARTVEVKEAQKLQSTLKELGRGTVALYTLISNESELKQTETQLTSKGWVILVTPDFRRAYQIDVKELNQTVALLRQTMRNDQFDPRPPAQKLYRMIFQTPQPKGKTLAEDLEAYLKNQPNQTLMWSLDGILRYVPIGTLHDGKQYLVERYRNVVFTTASLSELTSLVSQQWKGLGLGVSKEYKPFSPLPGVTQELEAIIRDPQNPRFKGVLPGIAHENEEFQLKTMLDHLREDFPAVHIASHFYYNLASPPESFLLLGDGSHLEMVQFEDMENPFEKTELLTLSACDTATGDWQQINGKDAEGLAYVAQRLGAKSVLASLWPVDDIGTQVLMPKFYRLRQTGLTKAAALQQAQLSLLRGEETVTISASRRSVKELFTKTEPKLKPFIKDPKCPYAHPYYWAPFILIGNWK